MGSCVSWQPMLPVQVALSMRQTYHANLALSDHFQQYFAIDLCSKYSFTEETHIDPELTWSDSQWSRASAPGTHNDSRLTLEHSVADAFSLTGSEQVDWTIANAEGSMLNLGAHSTEDTVKVFNSGSNVSMKGTQKWDYTCKYRIIKWYWKHQWALAIARGLKVCWVSTMRRWKVQHNEWHIHKVPLSHVHINSNWSWVSEYKSMDIPLSLYTLLCESDITSETHKPR
jgi:hypothetical protein